MLESPMQNTTPLWELPDVTPANAYKLGLMVSDMVKAALEESLERASTANVEAFRKGVMEGLRELQLAIDAGAWPAPVTNQSSGKRRVVAERVVKQ